MIWPGRNLALVVLVPALLSLALLIPRSEMLKPLILGVDVLIGLVALIDLVSLVGAGRIRAERKCGAVASLGEPHEIELTLRNEGSRRRFLRVKDDVPQNFEADPDEFLVQAPGRGLVALDYKMIPKHRGSYVLRRVYLIAFSRLGMWQRVLRLPCESAVRVYPDVRQISRYTLLARRDKLSALGVRRSRRIGTDNDFERLRDYNEGDEPRHIDWRATARRRKLTVRDHQSNQSQRILFLIDSGRMMAGDTGGGLSPLDHALNAMLMLAHVALSRGDQVGAMVYADRIRAYLPPAGGVKRIRRMVHGVHNLFPELVESRHDRAFVDLQRRCRKRALVILLTNVFDDVNAQQILDHLSNVVGRHLPLGVFLRDHDIFTLADSSPSTGLGLHESAAAAAMLNWRESILSRLRQRGVLTLDVFPEELTAELINKYLYIKARHLL